MKGVEKPHWTGRVWLAFGELSGDDLIELLANLAWNG